MRLNKVSWPLVMLSLAGCLAPEAEDTTSTVASTLSTPSQRARRVFEHWTAARIASAQPRELRIDDRGLGYLEASDGSLAPYGHQEPAAGKPGGGSSDTTPPTISGMNPANGATVSTSSITFSAQVTDTSGIRSVSVVVQREGGTAQTFTASPSGGDTWSVTLNGFSDGTWSWYTVAVDNAARPGNRAQSSPSNFTVALGGGGGGSGGGEGVVVNDPWTNGGAIQTAAGRILFEMPTNKAKSRWAAYVCSGTVITDAATDRSIILTAAHCAYDDKYKAFARNVLFIPNQDETSGAKTDRDCTNDPLGCWAPTFAAVDVNWTTRTFPDNIQWDYAYYIVEPTGAHSGLGATDDLELAAGHLPVSFASPALASLTHGMGYSYSDDPHFMYCAEGLSTEGDVNWWLPSCGLSGGSSGGPWVGEMDPTTGTGSIMSVNSWGYTTSPGMAGPQLDRTTASCVLDQATGATLESTGVIATCQ